MDERPFLVVLDQLHRHSRKLIHATEELDTKKTICDEKWDELARGNLKRRAAKRLRKQITELAEEVSELSKGCVVRNRKIAKLVKELNSYSRTYFVRDTDDIELVSNHLKKRTLTPAASVVTEDAWSLLKLAADAASLRLERLG